MHLLCTCSICNEIQQVQICGGPSKVSRRARQSSEGAELGGREAPRASLVVRSLFKGVERGNKIRPPIKGRETEGESECQSLSFHSLALATPSSMNAACTRVGTVLDQDRSTNLGMRIRIEVFLPSRTVVLVMSSFTQI